MAYPAAEPLGDQGETLAVPKTPGAAEKKAHGRTRKRSEYLSWDDYFMSLAFLTSKRSKDPATQVGACIVNQNNQIVGIGYNGFPRGISENDDMLPWGKVGEKLDTKYPYVCHAEMNAISNTPSLASLQGCRLYSSLFPCNECSKLIIQSGITKVIYSEKKTRASWEQTASERMFDLAGIGQEQFTPSKPVELPFGERRVGL